MMRFLTIALTLALGAAEEAAEEKKVGDVIGIDLGTTYSCGARSPHPSCAPPPHVLPSLKRSRLPWCLRLGAHVVRRALSYALSGCVQERQG